MTRTTIASHCFLIIYNLLAGLSPLRKVPILASTFTSCRLSLSIHCLQSPNLKAVQAEIAQQSLLRVRSPHTSNTQSASKKPSSKRPILLLCHILMSRQHAQPHFVSDSQLIRGHVERCLYTTSSCTRSTHTPSSTHFMYSLYA